MSVVPVNNYNLLPYVHPQENEIRKRLDDNLISDEYCNQLLENYKLFDLEKELPDYIGKCLEVNEYQFPQIYEIVKDLSGRIGITIPTIYIYESYYFATDVEGLDKPWLQIPTKSIENFEPAELRYIIARELTHIKLDHMKYEVLCEEFAKNLNMATNVLTIPGFETASRQAFEIYASRFKLISANWSRVTEYTADRCALAVCEWDIKSAVSAILKQILNSNIMTQNTDLPSFLAQTESIMSFTTNAAKYTRMDELAPYEPFRLKELIAFAGKEMLNKLS